MRQKSFILEIDAIQAHDLRRSCSTGIWPEFLLARYWSSRCHQAEDPLASTPLRKHDAALSAQSPRGETRLSVHGATRRTLLRIKDLCEIKIKQVNTAIQIIQKRQV